MACQESDREKWPQGQVRSRKLLRGSHDEDEGGTRRTDEGERLPIGRGRGWRLLVNHIQAGAAFYRLYIVGICESGSGVEQGVNL